MTTPQRTVRQLRLSAPSRAQALAMLPRLEDALRCASLPDDGARLLVVRRLALGRLRHDIDATALTRLVERRVAAAEGGWVDATAPAAASAEGVVFASVLDARIALSLRLLRGEPVADWYWPLAVPEAAAAAGPGDRVRLIARAVATSPEARVGLPAWAAALVHGGVGPRLAMVIAPAEGEALLQLTGLAGRHRASVEDPARHGPAVAPAVAPQVAPAVAPAVAPTAATRPADPRAGVAGLPVWLQSLLSMSATLDARATVPVAVRLSAASVALQAEAGTVAAAESGPMAGLRPTPARDDPPARPGDAGDAGDAGAAILPSGHVLDRAAASLHTRSMADRPGASAGATRQARPAPPAELAAAAGDAAVLARWADGGAATAVGGLLFLLPLLARLGLADWCDPQGDAPAFTAKVLQAALRRLAAADDDPAWGLALAAGSAGGLARDAAASVAATPTATAAPSTAVSVAATTAATTAASPAAPPAAWHDARLAPRACPPLWMAQQLAAAATAEAQAALWLDACRRWLRRSGGIGLASLVRRPGRLALTASHADLFFRLDQTDLRVRRLGLDIDPGWLPWFGRVVAFHYRQGPR